MDAFCISCKILGTHKDLLINDKEQIFVDSVPSNTWYLTGDTKEMSYCFDTLLALLKLELNLKPTFNFINSMNIVAPNVSDIPWRYILPLKQYKQFINSIIEQCKQALKCSSKIKTYCNNMFYTQTKFLNSLHTAKVDLTKTTLQVPQEFIPNDSGYLQQVKYNRFKSRTGRLIVNSGPTILTLKKELKNIITSSFDNGKIFSLDFASLEARILLYEAGRRCEDDLYLSVSKLLSDQTERNIIKQATLALIYGSGKQLLSQILGFGGKDLDDLMSKIRIIFDVENLTLKIKQQYQNNGFIYNKYGRIVNITDSADHILLNSYIQSTGVDVSLYGFSEIVKNLILSKPIFVIHDALLIDVHQNEFDLISQINKIKIPGYVQKFVIKSEILN